MGTWIAREIGFEAVQDLGYFCLLIGISGFPSLLVPSSVVPWSGIHFLMSYLITLSSASS